MKDGNISLLWQLQNIEDEIHEINREIRLNEIKQSLKGLKNEHENLKKDLQDKVVQYKEWEHKLSRINLKNKNSNFKIKELQDRIYGGEIINITAISKLECEVEELKKEIDNSDEEILYIMEKTEIAQIEIKNKKQKLLKIQEKYKIMKDNYNLEKEKLQNKNALLLSKHKSIKGKIEDKYIQDYINIQKNIKQPMALIKGGVCTGCNMNISIILLKDIKESPKIYHCENCGRILYLENNK